MSPPTLPPAHAAVIAINEAVERGCLEGTAQALRNPNAMLADLQEHLMPVYQEMLRQARAQKAARASNKVGLEEVLPSAAVFSHLVCLHLS